MRVPFGQRWVGSLACMVVGASLVSSAVRAEDAKRVAVLRFSGPGADRVREAVVAAIEEKGTLEILSGRKVAGAARRLGVDLESPKDFVAVARDLRVAAFVAGTVTPGKKPKAAISARNGADGEELTEGTFTGARLIEVVQETFWKRMGRVLEGAKMPAVEEEEKASDEPRKTVSKASEDPASGDADAVAGVDASTGDRAVAIDFAAGSHIFSRNFSYTDDIRGQLRPYRVPVAPAPAFSLDWYPGAHFTGGFTANVGVTVSGEQAVALVSKASSGVTYPTESRAYSAGLRVRIPLGAAESSVTGAYGGQSFIIRDADSMTLKPDIPDVDYRFFRVGVAARLALPASVSLMLSGAYLFVSGSGQMEDMAYFPRSKVGGVEAALAVGYGLGAGFEARVGADVRRYAYTMSPEPGDPFIAGGAVDQYLAGSVSLAYRLSQKPGR